MERIKGEMLVKRWPKLSDQSKKKVPSRLQELAQEMRSLSLLQVARYPVLTVGLYGIVDYDPVSIGSGLSRKYWRVFIVFYEMALKRVLNGSRKLTK